MLEILDVQAEPAQLGEDISNPMLAVPSRIIVFDSNESNAIAEMGDRTFIIRDPADLHLALKGLCTTRSDNFWICNMEFSITLLSLGLEGSGIRGVGLVIEED